MTLVADVIVLSARRLFTHTRSDLGHEVQNYPKAEVSSLATSVGPRVLDATCTPKRIRR